MAVQKKLRSGDVAMLDKKKILNIVTGDKNFNIKISKPFYPLSIEFLNDFSNALKNFKKIKTYPDLIYLMFLKRIFPIFSQQILRKLPSEKEKK